MVLITGMAGVGKSELALQYAKSKRDEFKGGIAYLSAANLVEGLQDFLMRSQIAGTKDLRLYTQDKAKAKASWEIWQEFCDQISAQALVVIDDVTDYQAQVADFLPKLTGENSPFRIVLTSRTGWDDLPSFELEELALGAAQRMFCNYVGTKYQDRVDGQIATVESLCLRLGCLPLALALTGSWLRVTGSGRTLTGLITALEAADLAQSPLEPNPLATRRIAEKGLKAAFQVSWEQLPQLDLSAQQLARVLSLFAPADLTWDLVEKVAACYPVELPLVPVPKRSWLARFWDWLRGLFGYRPAPPSEPKRLTQPIRNLPEARWALCRTSLLRTIRENDIYRVHPLLHEFFGLQWDEGTDRQGWEMAFSTGLSLKASTIPEKAAWEKLEVLQPLRPHFDTAIALITEFRKNKNYQLHPSLQQRFYDQLSDCQTGVARLSQIPLFVETYNQAKEKYHAAQNSLKQGQQETATQEFEEAISLYETAIDQGRQALGKNSLMLAEYLMKIAIIFEDRGLYTKGIPYLNEAISIANQKTDSSKQSDYLHRLAVLHRKQSNYQESESIFLQALQLREKLLGTQHLDFANTLNSLSALYYCQGKYAEAEPLYRRSLSIREKQLGSNHPDVAQSLNNLANLYYAQGKCAEAEPLYSRSLELREKQLSSDHPDVANSLWCIGAMYYKQGNYQEAEKLISRALKIFQQALGDDHPNTQTVQGWLNTVQQTISENKQTD